MCLYLLAQFSDLPQLSIILGYRAYQKLLLLENELQVSRKSQFSIVCISSSMLFIIRAEHGIHLCHASSNYKCNDAANLLPEQLGHYQLLCLEPGQNDVSIMPLRHHLLVATVTY